jgi:hypothetical protein
MAKVMLVDPLCSHKKSGLAGTQRIKPNSLKSWAVGNFSFFNFPKCHVLCFGQRCRMKWKGELDKERRPPCPVSRIPAMMAGVQWRVPVASCSLAGWQ